LTEPTVFNDVCDALESAGVEALSKEILLLPTLPVMVEDVAVAKSVLKFIAALEDNDDVQNVYSSMDMTDEVMSGIGEEA
jgi:transcriptional/translational regulatory protein YebC/TACO1